MRNTNKFIEFAVITVISFIILFLTACPEPEPEPEHVHQWGAWTVTTPATCIAKGVETRTCTLDAMHKETRDISINPTAHDWEQLTGTAPTCTETGSGKRKCRLCAVEETLNIIPALGHDWGEWEQTKAPTEDKDGEKVRTCKHDATHKETEAIAALDHTHVWGEWSVKTPATCTTQGERVRVCTLNAAHEDIEDTPIDPNAHDWGDWIQTTAPTCTTAGIKTRTCTHDPSHIDPQTQTGEPALGHQWNDKWVITIPPTLTGDGVETDTCAHDSSHTRTRSTTAVPAFTTVASLGTYLSNIPPNTATTAYKIALKVNDLGGDYNTSGSAGYVLIANNTKYVSFDLSDSTINIVPNSAFFGCTSLASVTIGNGVTSIENIAFINCTSLASVTIPNSVNSISSNAFSGCTSLTEINVETANSVYSSQDGVLYNKNKTTLIIYPVGKTNTSFDIPNSVTDIGINAFLGCTKLISITIPNSVISIESYAFERCSNLTSITIPTSVTSIANWAFMNCTSLTAFNVDSTNSKYSSVDGVLYNKDKTILIQYPIGKISNTFTIPDSVTSIESGAFLFCTRLTNITIPDSVTNIGGQSFWYTNLVSVIIPNSVTSIGEYAFLCNNLTSVMFERADTAIADDNSFPNGSSLRTAYTAGGIGTYTRQSGGTTWTKQ